jgi:hypothetical protein
MALRASFRRCGVQHPKRFPRRPNAADGGMALATRSRGEHHLQEAPCHVPAGANPNPNRA